MDVQGALIRKFFYPLWAIYEGEADLLKYLSYFDYVNDLSREQLLQSQFEKLRNVLIHAFENTDYYQTVFKKLEFSPYDMKDASEIQKVPVLTKSIIKQNFQKLIARNIPSGEALRASTGGSTGTPLEFLRDKKCIKLRRGQEMFFDNWMGYKIGQKIGYFVAGSHYDGPVDHFKAKVKNATRDRMLSFDPHNITNTYIKSFIPQLIEFKPEMLKCFPNALTPLAIYLKKNNIKVPPVRSISCTGENLYQQQRDLFEDVFGGEVFEKVGTRESGVYACECRQHHGLHVFTEGAFLEIIKDNGEPAGEGELGKLYLTDLFNRAMPLIRYEIGDMAISGGERKCSCGSELPLIEKYLGRDRDIIVDVHGNPKPGYLFVETIKHMNLDAQFQIIQPEKNRLVVNVSQKSADAIELEKIRTEFQNIIGQGVQIHFYFVDEIKRDPSGKFSYVKSNISLFD